MSREKLTYPLIYDVETVNAILNKNEIRQAGIRYAQGWSDYIGMGIAVVAAYDYAHDCYRVFDTTNLDHLIELISKRGLFVGYNNRSFDNKLLAAHGVTIPSLETFDILEAIRVALGYTPKGLTLDAVVQANFPYVKKTDKGALAPVYWQRGERMRVIDYCLNDVRMTKLLFDIFLNQDSINTPFGVVKIRKPFTDAPVCTGCNRVDLQPAAQVQKIAESVL